MKLFDVYPLFGIEIQKGKGAYVYDNKGQKYLDLYGGHAVISIGHAHQHYVEKIQNQVAKLGFYSNSIENPLQVEYAKKLGHLSGCENYNFFFINSGAEAIENAIKIASFHNKKSKVISFEKGFHGRTAGAVSITDNPKIQAPVNQALDNIILPMGNIEKVLFHLQKDEITAIVIEGIQGIGGINIPEKDFLVQLSRLCEQYNCLLILDEIQSGFGRSGKFFSYQYAGIKPDIITVAKGMGNGFPMGGVLVNPKVEAWYGMAGSTFGGNHLACAAGLAVLEVIEKENLLENATAVGNYFQEELKKIDGIKEVRGKGLMIGIEMDFPIKEFRKQLLFEEHIFTGSSSNPNVLRILPPLNIDTSIVNYFIEKFKNVLAKYKVEI